MLKSFCKDIYNMLSSKYPNRNIFIIGDEHFYHYNIINYTRTNFSSIEEMNNFIIKTHNEVVGKDDIIIFLGDFCFKANSIKEIINKLNGHKYLIIGNHDKKDLIKTYPKYGFEGIFLNPVKINEDYLSHEPLKEGERTDLQFELITKEFESSSQGINYHGHIHELDNENNPRFKNVTCENISYKPLFIGRTKQLDNNEKQNFINSSYFNKVLNDLMIYQNFDGHILLSDYIYSIILESCEQFKEHFYINGSFGLLKKYGFLSKLSDLDISAFYNPSMSKKQNSAILKKLADEAYESLRNIEGINLEFVKKYFSLRIFKIYYTNAMPFYAQGAFDANLISLDCYRESDFKEKKFNTIIEKYVQKNDSRMADDFVFPTFTCNTLNPECDMANLLLQYIFQQNHPENKKMLLKKIKFLYNQIFSDQDMVNFDDILTRFFLKNVYFLYTLRRLGEIEYIQNQSLDILSNLNNFSLSFKEQLYSILYNPNSTFLETFKELSLYPVKDVNNFVLERTKQIKNLDKKLS